MSQMTPFFPHDARKDWAVLTWPEWVARLEEKGHRRRLPTMAVTSETPPVRLTRILNPDEYVALDQKGRLVLTTAQTPVRMI